MNQHIHKYNDKPYCWNIVQVACIKLVKGWGGGGADRRNPLGSYVGD